MGVSTDAYLVFGIPLEEESEWPLIQKYDEDSDCRFLGEEWFLSEAGWPLERLYEEFSTWEERQEKRNEILLEIGLAFQRHCSDSYPMYILTSERVVSFVACRGSPSIIEGLPLKIPHSVYQELQDFCTKYNIPYTTPQWYLCSYWGV